MINSEIPKGSIKEWVIKVKTQNPDFTLQAVGDICGVTREYVRQVLNSNGIDTTKKIKPMPQCVTCTSEMSRSRAMVHTECSACVKASKRTVTTCPNCGTEKETLKSHIKRNINTFCNNYCQFSHWGKMHGFQKAKKPNGSEWQDYNHNKIRPTIHNYTQEFVFKD